MIEPPGKTGEGHIVTNRGVWEKKRPETQRKILSGRRVRKAGKWTGTASISVPLVRAIAEDVNRRGWRGNRVRGGHLRITHRKKDLSKIDARGKSFTKGGGFQDKTTLQKTKKNEHQKEKMKKRSRKEKGTRDNCAAFEKGG